MTALLDLAVGWRHGLVAAADSVPGTMADLPVANWSATSFPGQTGATAGGVAFRAEDGRAAAIAEAIERYVATMCDLPVGADPTVRRLPIEHFTLHSSSQVRQPDFPYAPAYRADQPMTVAYRAGDHEPALVPVGLVTLDPNRSRLATSSGLAADPSPWRALLRATEELIERDALMTTWLHGVGPARVALPAQLEEPVHARGGAVTCLDLTPAYSPHPVAAVAGNLPERGRPRLSLGVACRARWADAVEKAWLEWAQGTTFAAVARDWFAGEPVDSGEVTGFDQHAVYYTLHPDEWPALPLWRGIDASARPPDSPVTGPPRDQLEHLIAALAAEGVDVYYRDLTTVDAAQLGIRVVRALAPRLVPIHGNHRWPHLGGTASDLAFRYPGAEPGCRFPNPAPHPLG